MKALRGGLGPGSHFPDKVDSWEDFDIYSRCITRGMVSSMLPTLYNFGNEILQAPGYVMIRNEMIHETRVIPFDGRPHVGKDIRMYMGDSRGHWEGNTLVVETTNLKAQPGAGGGLFTDDAVLTERFTRISPTELSYDLTVNDPKTWTKPWTLHMPYKLDPQLQDLRVRLPRRQLHDAGRPQRRSRPGKEGPVDEGGSLKVPGRAVNYSFNAYANNALPAEIATYCLPFTA